ncbi:MAG: PmbA/TldA family metallopeptidase, partial [Thermoplasmata archaeon]
MDTDLVDFAVEHARSKGASYAEARLEEQANETFVVKGGVVDALDFTESRGVGVRVLAGGSLG